MTKQEQRHEIIIAMINKGYEIMGVVIDANRIMAEMYGKDWKSQPEVEYIPGCGYQHAETFHPLIAEKHDCPNFERVPIVSIAEQDDQRGVRFCIGDVDMFIEAHNLDDGKEYEWPDAMKRPQRGRERNLLPQAGPPHGCLPRRNQCRSSRDWWRRAERLLLDVRGVQHRHRLVRQLHRWLHLHLRQVRLIFSEGVCRVQALRLKTL